MIELDLSTLSPECTLEDVVKIAAACGMTTTFKIKPTPVRCHFLDELWARGDDEE